MALPPLSVGAFHVMTTFPSLSILATTLVGAPGTVRGVIAADGADASPVPMPFVAATVKVYAVPLVRPVTVNCVAVFAS